MKKITLFIIFLTLNTSAQVLKVSVKDLNLKGKVKQMIKKVYQEIDKDKEIDKDTKCNTFITNFNELGLTTSIDNSMDLKNLKVTGTCEYDSFNRPILLKTKWRQKIHSNTWNWLKTVKYTFIDKIEYNPSGTMAILDKFKDDEKFTRKIFKFNRRNKVVEATIVSTLDNKDKERRESYEYDDQGVMVKSSKYNFHTRENVTKKYRHDNRGNITNVVFGLPGEDFMNTTKKYNEQNDVIEEMSNYNGKFLANFSTYIYDKHNNFIKKVEITNDGKKLVTTREFIYYE